MSAPQLATYPGAGLLRDEIIAYLLDCKSRGWCQEVYRETFWVGGVPKEGFVMRLSLHKDIFIRPSAIAGWDVLDLSSSFHTPVMSQVRTLEELERAMPQAAARYKLAWPQQQTSARLQAGTPATNVAKISGLIVGAEIQAVFDPYLDNAALTTLVDILSFGGSLANDLRLLSSPAMTQGNNPRLTKSLVTAWFTQRGITAGEARLLQSPEHRRFMLLSGGQSLLVGMSLNAIAKNEAIRLEPDREDRPFFDGEWAKAAAL